MLKIVRSMGELPLDQLYRVYGESLDADYLRFDFFRVPGAMYCLWILDERCVSAVRLEPWRDGMLLTALETAPDRRRSGYAKDLLMEIFAHLRGLGVVSVYSHVVKQNTASIRTHEACGFSKLSDTAAYLDGSVDSRAYTYVRNI